MDRHGVLSDEERFQNVIRLQLRKPKRWNWELSTSKSSPHLLLPTIQLFDAKGRLLVEAQDKSPSTERRLWRSYQLPVRGQGVSESQEAHHHQQQQTVKLQRSRSDISQRCRSQTSPAESWCDANNNKSYQASVPEKEQGSNERMKKKVYYGRTKSDDTFACTLSRSESLLVLESVAEEGPGGGEGEGECRYDLCTSKAGTLIVKRHSFAATRRRRRAATPGSDSRSEFKDARIEGDRYSSVAAATAAAGMAHHHRSIQVNAVQRSQSCCDHRRPRLPRPRPGAHHCEQHEDARGQSVGQSESLRAYCDTSSSDEDLPSDFDMQRVFDHSFRSYKKRQSRAKAPKGTHKNAVTFHSLERHARLSPVEDVRKMGANVSRPSSKGLSGRRTQSSGSICKNKKSEPDQEQHPVCGSLPSYLETSNNNHTYEKLPLNDVDRLPPLGDGAPLHWKFSENQTVFCDQGYGSERSPEEEFPPPLPEHDIQCNHHLDIHSCYPFITPETTFGVSLAKGSRGLGLSVTGGIDSGGSWPGLIRVKRLFPHQPAAACGVLNVGDLILEANGIPLTGLTNYEALEVLRTSSSQVELRMCRPPADVLNCVSPISEVPPPPPRREPAANLTLTPDQLSNSEEYNGEFEISMRKSGGSLGFTLRKEDDSALGHYIRALVRDPALTDGRIRPGDKIIAVNNVEISSMSHDEAVQFLRKCGQMVKLRLYRDAAQTPVATLSPTETTPRTSFTKKVQLRQEAMDMLNDIAVRKLLPNSESYMSRSPLGSPRRIRSRAPCPSDPSQETYYVPEEQFHEGLLQQGGYLPLDEESFNSLFIADEDYDDVDDDDCDKPSRPLSLELYNPNQTPVAGRKPKFNFSLAHNAYELNNLDAEILDAPHITYNLADDPRSGAELEKLEDAKEPTSMPHLPVGDNSNAAFKYKNPTYQSAHPVCGNGNVRMPNGVSEERKANRSQPSPGNSNTLPKEPEKKPRRKKSIIKEPRSVPGQPEIMVIELNRGWNSRMGFSLQGPVGHTFVSAVYPNSIASRDGRIREGDRILQVNDDSVEKMSTNEIIDLLRILRGPVSIVLLRNPRKQSARNVSSGQPHMGSINVNKDCTSKASNAVN